MSPGRGVAKRLLVAALVAVVVVVAAVGFPAPGGSGGVDDGPDHPAYRADRLAPERIDADGRPDPSGDVGVVLFDRSADNRFEREDVDPLVRAITEAGGDVEFGDPDANLSAELDGVDVLVVVDPGREYDDAEVGTIRQFVADGGRVLVLGEPNRKELQQAELQVSLATRRSQLTSLGSAFGVSFGTEYLYDMETNDGNFKAIVVGPPDGADAPAVDGVGRVIMYTAASVDVDGGTVLLRTASTAERGDAAADRGYPVAVLAAGGAVMAVGDATFLSDGYHAVGDNEVFVERIVEFMAGADRGGPDSGSAGGADGPGGGSAGSAREPAVPPAPDIARPAG